VQGLHGKVSVMGIGFAAAAKVEQQLQQQMVGRWFRSAALVRIIGSSTRKIAAALALIGRLLCF
jgi:hypothetical protein